MNTDRALVREFLRDGRTPVAIASNPLAQDLDAQIVALDQEQGTAVLAFAPSARFVQGAGVLQGGIITALLDFAMAFAAHARLAREERAFATATLTVNLLRPAPPGRYLARGRIVRAGSRLLYAEAELIAATGEDGFARASALMPLV